MPLISNKNLHLACTIKTPKKYWRNIILLWTKLKPVVEIPGLPWLAFWNESAKLPIYVASSWNVFHFQCLNSLLGSAGKQRLFTLKPLQDLTGKINRLSALYILLVFLSGSYWELLSEVCLCFHFEREGTKHYCGETPVSLEPWGFPQVPLCMEVAPETGSRATEAAVCKQLCWHF